MTKEKTPAKIGPRAVTTLRQIVLLPGEPTLEPEFFNTLGVDEYMEVTSGTCLIVRNNYTLQEMLFLEDEIIKGPLAYVNRGEPGPKDYARQSVAGDIKVASMLAGIFGLFTLFLVVAGFVCPLPEPLLLFRDLGCVFTFIFFMIALYFDQLAKNRPAAALHRNCLCGPLKVKFPANAQPVD